MMLKRLAGQARSIPSAIAKDKHSPQIRSFLSSRTRQQQIPHSKSGINFNASASASATPSRFSRYAAQLNHISSRTGVPLPALVVSFAILHELTAILPLIVLFFAFQAANVGGYLVESFVETSEAAQNDEGALRWRRKVREWLEEGERKVDKVAARYGILGYEKGQRRLDADKSVSKDDASDCTKDLGTQAQLLTKAGAAASVTNALAAYVAVKALFPLRIAASLYFAPGFSRLAIDPVRRIIMRTSRMSKGKS